MKKFIDKYSPRTIRLFFTILTVIASTIAIFNFMRVMVYNVTSNDQCAWRAISGREDRFLITDVVPDGVSDRAGIRNGDTLLAIDGKPVKGNFAQAYIDAHRSGEFATYLIARGTRKFEVQVEILKMFDIRYFSQALLGIGFLLVGYIVVLTRPQGFIQRKFAWYGITCLLFFCLSSSPALQADQTRTVGTLLFAIGFLSARLLAPRFTTFFMNFPVRWRILDRKWFVPLLYSVNTLIVATFIDVDFIRSLLPAWVRFVAYIAGFAWYVAGLVIFTYSFRKLVAPAKRKELRHILIAVTAGIVILTYFLLVLLINPFLIYIKPGYMLPVLVLVLVPFAFGYAIFRYRLMDIDLVVKRSLIYGAVTASLAVIYLLLVFGLGSLLTLIFGQSENKMLSVIALVVIAFVFDPVKRRTQEYIDRIFYRERYNYQKALSEFSQELPRLMNLDQILQSMVNRISDTMHVEKVAIILCDDKEGCHCIAQNIPEEYCHFISGDHGLIDLLRTTRNPQSLALLSEEPDSVPLNAADRERIIGSGVILAVPMVLQDRLIGTINVGFKMSGKAYSREDIDLLSTVASQAAIAIENARLHISEIAKQKIEEELALARRIQQGLLPKASPEIPGLDISGISIPALSVGGDYFDYIRISPAKLLVVIADVSGKGMSASLYMSKVQGMVQLATQMYSSPRDILVHVNRMLYEGMERKSFITMILALFDLGKKEVHICRAGHNKAIIRTNGVARQLNARGIGLGLERGPIFEGELEEVRHPITPGSLFVFYTDGLTEVMNENGAEMGENTVVSIVNSASASSARQIQETLVTAAREFQGPAEQHDDLTLVIVKAT